MNTLSQIISVYSQMRRKNILHFLITFLLTFICLYIVSPGTSPSNPYLCTDTSVFLTMGTAFTDGALPYRDYFDHKGPLLYYIYAIAQYDELGKFGIFILQTLAWSISIFAIWKTLRIFIRRDLSLVSLIVFLLCSFACLGGGGLTEDWSLPVSSVLLYIILNHLKSCNQASTIPNWMWFCLGLGIAWHSMLRITNAGVTSGEIFALLILLAYEKSWKKMVISIIWMLLGFFIVIFPIIMHFVIENAEKDLWYGLYDFNHKYAIKAYGNKNTLNIFFKIIPAISIIVTMCTFCKFSKLTNKIKLIIFSTTISTTISVLPGYAFDHYFINFAPIICFSLIIFCLFITEYSNIKKATKYFITFSTLALLVAPYIMGMKRNLRQGIVCTLKPGHPVGEYNKYTTAQRFSELIKASKSSRVLAIDCAAEVYCYMGIKPCDKFFFLQSFLSRSDPQIKVYLTERLSNNNSAPDWIILPKRDLDEKKSINTIDKDFASIIKANYLHVDSAPLHKGKLDHSYSLYRRKQ